MDTAQTPRTHYLEDEESFWFMDLDAETNIPDLLVNVAATAKAFAVKAPELVGIVSETDGGIIAYALGVKNAKRIVAALADKEG